MNHSQLKIVYPQCPFLWNSKKLNDIYYPSVTKLNRDDFLIDIIDTLLNNENSVRINKEMLRFISDSTHDDTKENDINNILFYKCEQNVPGKIKKAYINFHTACYCQDYTRSLNKTFNGAIEWCVIPIRGDINCYSKPISIIRDESLKVINRKIDEDTKDEISNKILKKKMTDRGTLIDFRDSNTDNRDKYELNKNMNARLARRGFFHNGVSIKQPKAEEKHDVFKSISENINIKDPILTPKKKKIQFNNNTRKNAQLIRMKLLEKCKVHRLKQNPHLLENWKKVDLSLLRIAPNKSEQNNKLIKNKFNLIKRDCFDYKDDKVGVAKVSGMYRFAPINSGKIKIKHNNEGSYFVSLMKYKNTMHATIHVISCLS